MKRGGTEPPRAKSDSDSEWGLPKNKTGMSRETKIGLCLILVLACAFAFVVYKRVQRRNGYLAEQSDHAEHQHAHHHNRPLKPTTGNKPFKKDPVFEPTKEPFVNSQHEPKKLDEFDPENNQNLPSPKRNRRFGRKSNPFDGQKEPKAHEHNHQHAGQNGGNPFAGASHSSHQHGGAGKVSLGPEKKSSGENPFGSFGGGKSSGPFSRKQQSTASNGQKSEDVWELGGKKDGKSSITVDTPENGNPFPGGQKQSGHSHGKTGQGPSFVGPHNKQVEYQLPKDDKPFDPRHPGGSTGQSNAKPLPLFGGQSTPDKTVNTHGHNQHNHNHHHPGGTHQPPDRKFGRFQVGAPRSAQANSSTTVQTGGTREELEYPFGRPGNRSSQHTHQTGTGRQSLQGSPFGGQPFANGGRKNGQFDSFPLHHGQGIDPTDKPKAYRVQYGDNYWTISRKAYGTARYYTALDAYNRYRIPNPNRMRPGMIVLIPSVDILAKRFPKLCPGGGHGHHASVRYQPTGFFRDRDGCAMYRVGKTDTLSDIAQKHLGRASRWIQVYRMNQDRITDPNRLKIGTTLRLPSDASNIQVVRGPGRYR